MRERNFKALQQQAYDYIKELILTEKLEYNQIYSESKLAREINISRTPVRDAVHRLYQEGLIDIIPNKGFMLHTMTEKDVMEIYEIRSAIESYCVRQLAADCKSKSVQELTEELKRSLEKQQAIYEGERNVEQFATEDQNFHNLLVGHSQNEAFENIFCRYSYQIKKLSCYSLKQEGRMFQTMKEHRAIYEAICSGKPLEAYEASIVHMNNPLNFNLESVYG